MAIAEAPAWLLNWSLKIGLDQNRKNKNTITGLSDFTPKTPKKDPQNTKHARFEYFFGVFWGVFSWGSRISRQGQFSVFLVELSGRAILGAM